MLERVSKTRRLFDVNTAVNREPVNFNQDALNRVFYKTAQGKKIIILGANWKSVIFRRRYNIDVAYYAVMEYSDELYGQTYDGVEVKSVYDLAFEKRGEFYVVGADIETLFDVPHRLASLGLTYYDDYCQLVTLVEGDEHITDDAHLHFSMEYELPGIKIFGDVNDTSALRIIALGGSTTAANINCAKGACWPQHLYDMLQRSNIPAVVFNCGMQGFASPREFIKLCRDGITLDPDLVICYSGVNDHNNIPEFFTNRYKRPWIDHWTETQVRGAGNHLNGKMTYGLQNNKTPAESWVTHVKMMYGVCNELGIKCAGFFQSYIGTNGEPSEFEKKLQLNSMESFYSHKAVVFRALVNNRVFEAIEEYTNSITELIKDISYIFNMRYIFKDNTELLVDPCHTADAGNHLIAQNIFKVLLENGYFDRKPPHGGVAVNHL